MWHRNKRRDSNQLQIAEEVRSIAEMDSEERKTWDEDWDREDYQDLEGSSVCSWDEHKSMLKHIMKKCKIVNYVDKETSSGTQISSRQRSSRFFSVRMHKTHHESRGAHEKQHYRSVLETWRTQSMTRKLGLRILNDTNDDDWELLNSASSRVGM